MAEHVFAGLRCSEVADLAPAFVLGALEAAELDAVRRHLAECPEPHPEMAELGAVVPVLFEQVDPVAPPEGLKARILAAAAAEGAPASATTAVRPAAVEPIRPDTAPASARPTLPAEPRRPVVVERQGWGSAFRRPIWAAVSAAALVAAIALGAWNLQLRNEISGLTAYRDGVVAVLDEAAEPGAQLAVLTSPEGAGPAGLAAVAADGSVALVMRDLAPTTGTQVYETWLIAGDAAPVPIGGFIVDASGTASFIASHTALGDGVTVALTLEPARGAATPTLPIIAVGTARSQS